MKPELNGLMILVATVSGRDCSILNRWVCDWYRAKGSTDLMAIVDRLSVLGVAIAVVVVVELIDSEMQWDMMSWVGNTESHYWRDSFGAG
jgi:hypothetical protein